VFKILIVDDDPDMVEVGRIVLEKEGYLVESAANLAEGLAKLDSTEPDLLILDVMMEEPDDGLRFARQARREGHNLPIIMLTSVNRALGLQIGPDEEMVPVDEFIEKPVDPQTLVARVKLLLGEEQEPLLGEGLDESC
jgi:DNA-binding response OmpR family regulator